MDVKSRVPGKMVEVKVAVGDTVATKDVLGVMEAMKMNQNIACPCDGVVKEIKFAPGDRVDVADAPSLKVRGNSWLSTD